jgi:hypothetical protein
MEKSNLQLSISLKYCKPPPEAKHVKIGTRRKRGRPSKEKNAQAKAIRWNDKV